MAKILKTFIQTLLLALAFTSQAFADEPQANYPILNLEHYNVQEGLSQSTVTSVVEDQYGYVWIGTLNGLNRFDGKNFKHYFASNDGSSLPSPFIRSLYLDSNGKLLIGTDKGLVIYNNELDNFDDIENILTLKSSPIWSITEYNKNLIIGTNNEVFIFNNESFYLTKKIAYPFDGAKNTILTDDALYIRTSNGDVLKIKNSESSEVNKIESNVTSINKINGDIFATKNENLFSLEKPTKKNTLKRIKSISESDKNTYAIHENFICEFNSINKCAVIGSLEINEENNDRVSIFQGNKNIYVSIQSNGIYIFKKEKKLIENFLTSKNIWSITSINNSEILISSDSPIIEVYNDNIINIDSYDTGITGPKSALIIKNKIYIGTSKGLYSIDRVTKEKVLLNEGSFFLVKKDPNSNEIVAGSFNGKLVKLNIKNNYKDEIIVDDGNPIFDIQIHNNTYWLGTQFGLYEVNQGKINKVVDADLVSSLYLDEDNIYFGTRDSLSKINLKTKIKTKILSTKKPIYAITKHNQNIIASSNAEIIVLVDDKPYIFSLEYGSQKEYNSQAMSRMGDNIYIGGISGLSKASLDEINSFIEQKSPPKIVLDELSVFNMPVNIDGTTLSKNLNFTDKLALKYSDYPFTLTFVSPGNMDKALQYAYQMEGLSDNWLISKGTNSATYTNLSPGEYKFNVYAIDPLTNEKGQIKSINIEITPPWWSSLSAKIIYCTIVLIILALIIKAFLKRQEIQRQIAASEERLKLSLWGSGDEMWDWNIETGHIYRSNIWGSLEFPRDGQRSGESGEESNIHPMDQERVNTALNKHFYGETDHFEAAYRVKGKNNQWVWILDRAKIVERDENDKALRMTGTIKNIHNFKQAEEQLRLFERAIENISEGMFILDSKFNFVEVNQACCELCDRPRDYFIDTLFKFDLYPDSYSQQIRNILQQQGSWSNEIESSKGDGSKFLMELTVDAIYDEMGVLTHYVGVFSDISRRKRQEEELRKLTNSDMLTNLPNRSSLMVTLGNLVKKDTHHTLMVLDLDNFKKINDSLGHQVGDELLIKVSRRIESTVPSHTSIYRLGGDEFAILIDNNPDIGSSAVIAHNVVEAFSSPFELTSERVVVSVSIGIVLYPEDDQNEQALLRKADIAMYHAKSAGGNRYQFYSESLNRNAIRQLEVENLIREGLRDDLFEVHYQPKIDLRSGKMAGMEALVRLNHPTHGLIPPGEFIPLAEENGLIVEIGELVLRKACFAAQKWRREGLFDGRVAVNLSSLQFALPDLQDRITSILRLTQLPAANLELEITEGTVIKQPEKAIKVMMQLSKMGVHLALDDFGTGYSSLSYLKRFPINTLKIDKAFVDDIDKSDRDLKMVDSIITIAHNMGLSVVGEGVEEASQLSILKALKCEEIQGFIFSKAVKEEEFTVLLKNDLVAPQPLRKTK
ncbi:EAL domain-containing protein [Shewanella sp. AS1]|uniref:EAL domain-containing protein n=1 Tax=Shewanella sp. AS1 TaxID=2907626 RepID=UPI001F1D2532|nr:EAL domain-containing protein [Shewanella sp. AS1]MCE9679539.1 EAL domain-containing protein [Shewanella sp. AS1]